MFKYLSIISLAISCCTASAFASQSDYTFDFKFWNSGQNLNQDPWYLPGSHFVNGNTYSYTATGSEGDQATISMTWGGGGVASVSGNDMTHFSAAAGKSSSVTFDFGGNTVTDISFVVYGLQSMTGNTDTSTPGRFRIEGVTRGIESEFFNDNVFLSEGYYTRTTGQNQNGIQMVGITISASVTSLTLYFESQAYQISSLSFTSFGASAIPEPSTYAMLLALGVVAAVIIRRRK